ncbi:MAG: VOC family protein [Sphingomonadaceae bacterium]|nr:VOC family protein [Sphingomonadaceae bacterium]
MTIKAFLWFDSDAEAAARFYCDLFPDSRVDHVTHAPGDDPAGAAGHVLTVAFTLFGRPFVAMNGGPGHTFTDAISLSIETADQGETDRYWDALIADGGRAVMCGWCVDRWGLSWQIAPRALMAGLNDPDPAAAKRVFAAMMGMVKIDIAAVEAARAEG